MELALPRLFVIVTLVIIFPYSTQAELPLLGMTTETKTPDYISPEPSMREPLNPGMSFRETLKRWGPAREKIEYETHRRALWQYASAEVMFEEGKVISVRAVNAGVSGVWGNSDHMDAIRNAARKERVSPEAERVLSEILQEIPSNPDSQDPGIPPPGGAPITPPAAFSAPPPSMLAPYGSAPNQMYPHTMD